MRVIFFINHLAYGGAERVAATLLNHLCRKNDVTVVLFCDKKNSFTIDKKISTIKIISNSNNKITNAINRIRKIRKTIKLNAPDLIISFLTYTNVYVLAANSLIQRKIIISERTSFQRPQHIGIKLLRRLLYRMANMVVLTSTDDYYHTKWLKNKKVIYNPICFKSYTKYQNRNKTIISIGSQKRWHVKGFDLLIQAWAKIANSHSDWKVQFVGTNDNNYIKDLVKTYNLENQVDFMGWFDGIDKILQDKSIYVLSSRNEGFPNSLIEAMSQGCACVAFNCKTGPNEIITDGKSGLLVRNGDVDDLAAKLHLLIEDENLRQQLSAGAQEEVKRFDKELIMKQWDELIRSTIES